MEELYPDDEANVRINADAVTPSDADRDADNKNKSETGSNVAVASEGGMECKRKGSTGSTSRGKRRAEAYEYETDQSFDSDVSDDKC